MKFMKCLVCKRSENTHVKHTNLKEPEIVLQECLRRDLQWGSGVGSAVGSEIGTISSISNYCVNATFSYDYCTGALSGTDSPRVLNQDLNSCS